MLHSCYHCKSVIILFRLRIAVKSFAVYLGLALMPRAARRAAVIRDDKDDI